MKIRNRRTEDRVRRQINAKIRIANDSHEVDKSLTIIPCVISDISIGGVKIVLYSRQVININTQISVYVKTSKLKKAIKLEGIVRWRHAEYGSPSQILGVEFKVPKTHILNRWVTYANSIIENASSEDIVEETSAACPWDAVRR